MRPGGSEKTTPGSIKKSVISTGFSVNFHQFVVKLMPLITSVCYVIFNLKYKQLQWQTEDKTLVKVVTAGRGLFCGVQNHSRMYCKTMKICT